MVIWAGACSSPPLGIAPPIADGGVEESSPAQVGYGKADASHTDAGLGDETGGADVGHVDALSPIDAGEGPSDVSLPDAAPPDASPPGPGALDASDDADAAQVPYRDSAPDGRVAAYEDQAVPADVVRPEAGSADAGGADDGGARRCEPVRCGSQSWACWPMPNAASSGLPNLAGYTDMGDGTIRDNVTCLLWQKAAPQAGFNWNDAVSFCQTSPSLPGTGWRLPSRIELMSIIDYSKKSPAINVRVFPSTAANPPHWTASIVSSALTNAWTVSFFEGALDNADKSTMYLARCVRGNGEQRLEPAAPPGHYADTPDEVTDAYTGLVWQRADSQAERADSMSWAEAGAYCSSLALAGKRWRLPSIQELATLFDESAPLGATLPAVDHKEFPTMGAAAYWASTRADGTSPWSLEFKSGTMDHKTTKAFAKCVR